jgi:hypothetical protein
LIRTPKGGSAITKNGEARRAPVKAVIAITSITFSLNGRGGSQVFGAMLIPVKWDLIHQRFVIVELAIARHLLSAAHEFVYPFVFFSLFIISIGIWLPASLSPG